MVRRDLSRQSHHSGSSTNSFRSDPSHNTHSTTLLTCSKRSLLKYHHDRSMMHYDHLPHTEEPLDCGDFGSSRSSFRPVNTYASTISSEKDLTHHHEFEVPLTSHTVYPSDGVPSTAADFARLFTSDRRLLIHHDDATSDGNMNLRVDTEIIDSDGRPRKLILFHLRIHDLKERRFSLRRHCRDSGRQICSSSRKYSPAPALISASSNIQQVQLRFNHAGPVSHCKSNSGQGSARGSIRNQYQPPSKAELQPLETAESTTNKIQLEFSNYAHINLTKRGLKRSKRYEYEFWGTKYQWRRQIYQNGHVQEVSYHLINDKTSKSIAHITPKSLTAREAQEEEDFGGWVPPCTMQITDRRVFRSLTDVAE